MKGGLQHGLRKPKDTKKEEAKSLTEALAILGLGFALLD